MMKKKQSRRDNLLLVGAELPAEFVTKWRTMCDDHCYRKDGALHAAIATFMALPMELQVRLMSMKDKESDDIYTTVIDLLSERELSQHLAPLSDQQRKLVLETAKSLEQELFDEPATQKS